MSQSISIVIITYDRPDDMLELARNIASLQHPDLLKDVIVVNNASTRSYASVEEFISSQPHIPFRYIMSAENLGVSRGRNFAIEQSQGDLLLFLDDDALLDTSDALELLPRIFEEKENDRTVGVASFKVLYNENRQMQQTAFAHKQFDRRKAWHRFDAAYFVGCAHAIRKSILRETGVYPTNFFYGMEEYDLSYRVIDAGYSIVYDDRIVVLHKESPQGRLPRKEKLRGMWVNKTAVAFKYLPRKYFYSTALLWSLEYLKKTGFDLRGFFSGWRQVSRIPSTTPPAPLDEAAITYLQNVEARLSY